MMTTYLLRHAPTAYSASYRINGDPAVDVPLTAEGQAACVEERSLAPRTLVTCMTSSFARCQRTAELITAGQVAIEADDRLNELDYGDFEGGEFLAYARWLCEHGPHLRPPGARESQAEGTARMLGGLRAALDRQSPRLVVAHGFLVSVIQWAQTHPGQSLVHVFLPAAQCLTPLVLDDDELRTLTRRLVRDLERRPLGDRRWQVDLEVFPREVRPALATVWRSASLTNEDEAFHA
jgi:probable phosphoglycerate mutase